MKAFSAVVLSVLLIEIALNLGRANNDWLPVIFSHFKKKWGDMELTSLVSDCFYHPQRYNLESCRSQGKGKPARKAGNLSSWHPVNVCMQVDPFSERHLFFLFFLNVWYSWGFALSQVRMWTLRKAFCSRDRELKWNKYYCYLKKINLSR